MDNGYQQMGNLGQLLSSHPRKLKLTPLAADKDRS